MAVDDYIFEADQWPFSVTIEEGSTQSYFLNIYARDELLHSETYRTEDEARRAAQVEIKKYINSLHVLINLVRD